MPDAPANSAKEVERPPFMVKLGLLPPYMPEDVEKAYLARIKDIRPDLGGDPKPFYEVQTAYMQAKEYLKFRGDAAAGSPSDGRVHRRARSHRPPKSVRC